jgi:hypothetical protein
MLLITYNPGSAIKRKEIKRWIGPRPLLYSIVILSSRKVVKNKMPLCKGQCFVWIVIEIQWLIKSQGKNYLPQVMMLTTMITAKIVAVTSLPCTSTL